VTITVIVTITAPIVKEGSGLYAITISGLYTTFLNGVEQGTIYLPDVHKYMDDFFVDVDYEVNQRKKIIHITASPEELKVIEAYRYRHYATKD